VKKFMTPVVSFIQKQSKRNKIIAVGVFVALLIPAVTFGLKPDPKPVQPTPQPVSTGPSEQHEQVSAVMTEAPTEQPAVAPAPSSTPSQKPAAQKPVASTPKYNNSTALPAAQLRPPTFFIRISRNSVTSFGPNQFQVPYVAVHHEGHTAPITSVIAQAIPATGVYCAPFYSNNPGQGELSVSITASAPNGTYACKITLSDGTFSEWAQFSFLLQDGKVTIQ